LKKRKLAKVLFPYYLIAWCPQIEFIPANVEEPPSTSIPKFREISSSNSLLFDLKIKLENIMTEGDNDEVSPNIAFHRALASTRSRYFSSPTNSNYIQQYSPASPFNDFLTPMKKQKNNECFDNVVLNDEEFASDFTSAWKGSKMRLKNSQM
jgi:hypothetical protein